MAGPGIRYRHFALQLAETHDVTLMIPNETSERLGGVNVLHAREFGYRRFTRLCRALDVVVSQQLSVGAMEQLARATRARSLTFTTRSCSRRWGSMADS